MSVLEILFHKKLIYKLSLEIYVEFNIVSKLILPKPLPLPMEVIKYYESFSNNLVLGKPNILMIMMIQFLLYVITF